MTFLCQYAPTRTAIDLPDDLYRQFKAHAALGGFNVRELITRYLEQGVRTLPEQRGPRTRSEPSVAARASGGPIPARSRAELARLDEEERARRV